MPQQDRAASVAVAASGRRSAVAQSGVRCRLSFTESIGSLTLMTSATAELPDADIIVDEIPYSGIFNMSMDAALLQLAAERERSVVRIYQWSEPTVTLGYFQGSEQSLESPFPGLPVVRRLSGGGAILHDQEITYSLVLPASHPAPGSFCRLSNGSSGDYQAAVRFRCAMSAAE